MGWENYHLHLFRFGEKEYGIPDPDYPSEMRNERGRRLREFLHDEGGVFGYVYDFGDGWEHDIVLERIVTGVDVADVVCLEGERSFPPEDVGGPSGYLGYLLTEKVTESLVGRTAMLRLLPLSYREISNTPQAVFPWERGTT